MVVQNLFNKLSGATRTEFQALLDCIDKIFPLPAKHKRELPQNIAELSRLLTSARSERRDGYINNPATLQAYMRYFLPWNVYRLCKLFSSCEIQNFFLKLFDDNTNHTNNLIVDLGSGPFTLALAFWISFPALRERKLTLLNVDHNKLTLAAGRKLFTAFAGDHWEIKTKNCEFHELKKVSGAKLVCAINVYNEVFQKIPDSDTEKLARFADREARLLSSIVALAGGSAVLVVEPGVPRSGQFITLLKAALLEKRFAAAYPCPASDTSCAMRGGKRGAKWCHFSFESGDAPLPLRELSQHAGLSKEKAVLSFLLASNNPKHAISGENTNAITLRIISDIFTLADGRYGRYSCSPRGLILISGEKKNIEAYNSGTLLRIDNPQFKGTDKKSGAKLLLV